MGRYPTKNTDQDGLRLTMKFFKENNYLSWHRSGEIIWNRAFGSEASIGFTIDVIGDFPYIRLQYTVISGGEDGNYMNYKVPLVRIPCNLGGYRWAFKCLMYENGKYCNKIVYTLYRVDSDYFCCRHCANMVYESQRDSGKRYSFLWKIFDAQMKSSKLYDTIHKMHYRSKPTKKVIKYLNLRAKVPSITEFNKVFDNVFN